MALQPKETIFAASETLCSVIREDFGPTPRDELGINNMRVDFSTTANMYIFSSSSRAAEAYDYVHGSEVTAVEDVGIMTSRTCP